MSKKTSAPKVTVPVDVQGRKFKIGDKVARAAKYYQMDGLHIVVTTVTDIRDGKIYLNGAHQAMKFPDRLAILG